LQRAAATRWRAASGGDSAIAVVTAYTSAETPQPFAPDCAADRSRRRSTRTRLRPARPAARPSQRPRSVLRERVACPQIAPPARPACRSPITGSALRGKRTPSEPRGQRRAGHRHPNDRDEDHEPRGTTRVAPTAGAGPRRAHVPPARSPTRANACRCRPARRDPRPRGRASEFRQKARSTRAPEIHPGPRTCDAAGAARRPGTPGYATRTRTWERVVANVSLPAGARAGRRS